MTTDRDIWTDEQLLLTAEEAAKALSVGRTTLYALIKDGELRSVHIGRSCRLTRAELLRYVDRLDQPAVSVARKRRRTLREGAAPQTGLFELDPPPPDAA